MNQWLFRSVQRSDPVVRLFCFAHAGGSATSYRLWPAEMSNAIDLVALQLPGRANRLRETPFRSIDTLAEAVMSAIEDELDMPFVFFGHSMGATLAFEVVRRMRARGRVLPEHLIVSGRRAPGLPSGENDLHRLDDAEFIEEIGRRYGGIPPEILAHPDVLELLLPALRADIHALETFEYCEQNPLPMPISAFGGDSDPHANFTHLAAWRAQTVGPFRARTFPGGHFYLDSTRTALLSEISNIMSPIVARMRRSVA